MTSFAASREQSTHLFTEINKSVIITTSKATQQKNKQANRQQNKQDNDNDNDSTKIIRKNYEQYQID